MNIKPFKYFLAAISATVIWGIVSIPLRNLKGSSSEQLVCYRAFIALVLTWGIMLLFRKKQIHADIVYLKAESPQNRKKTLFLVLAAGMLLAANWLVFIYVVNHVSLKSAAFAYMISPLITALCGFCILKEHLSRLKLIAIGIALISILILAQGSLEEVLWSLFIAISFALYLIVQRVIVNLDRFNLLGVQLVIISLFVLPLFLRQSQLFPLEIYFWVNIFAIALLFTVIPLLLNSYALIRLPSSTVGIIMYLNPIVALVVAFFYFGEGAKTEQLYAYSLLLVSVIVFNWSVIGEIFNKKTTRVDILDTE